MEEEELVMLILQVTGVLTAGLQGALQKQSIFTKICSHYKKSFCFFKGFFLLLHKNVLHIIFLSRMKW